MTPVSDERLADLIHRTRLAAEVSGDAGYIGDEIASIMRELQQWRAIGTKMATTLTHSRNCCEHKEWLEDRCQKPICTCGIEGLLTKSEALLNHKATA